MGGGRGLRSYNSVAAAALFLVSLPTCTPIYLPPQQVGMELSKYGQVADVKIFEVLSAGYDPAEAVRIFVLFDRLDSAVKANIDLQGRFFGGKEVRVAFFPEERFDRQDLAPTPGEFGG